MSKIIKDIGNWISTEAVPKIKQAGRWIIDNKWLATGAAVFAVVFATLIVLLAVRIADHNAYQNDETISAPAGQGNTGAAGGSGAEAPGGQGKTDPADSGADAPGGQGNATDPSGDPAGPEGQEPSGPDGGDTTTPGGTDPNTPGVPATQTPGSPGSSQNPNPNPSGRTITLPAEQTDFSIELRVNEPAAYAGIEFALTLSDEDAQNFYSFRPELSGAIASPFVTVGGKHYFGFLAGSNAFPAGDSLVGSMNFTGYTSDKTLTITIVEMSVVRLDDNNKTTTTEKDSPAYVFTVQR